MCDVTLLTSVLSVLLKLFQLPCNIIWNCTYCYVQGERFMKVVKLKSSKENNYWPCLYRQNKYLININIILETESLLSK